MNSVKMIKMESRKLEVHHFQII